MKTVFQMNEAAARAAFQKEMDAFGLTVSGSTSGFYASDDLSLYSLRMRTEPQPVKGNKPLIDRLEAAGYRIEKYSRSVRVYGRYFVFTVCRGAVIKTKEVMS